MLCVTGLETTAAALERRIQNAPTHLHEVRLDAIDVVNDALAVMKRHTGMAFLACCRPVRQGGRYDGDEADRLALLAKANARYVDLESDVDDDAVAAIGRERVVLSWHDFEGVPADLDRRLRAMASRGTAVTKLAVTVDDASQLLALYEAGVRLKGVDKVLIGMGPAGLLSRSHFRSFGSRWCYVAGAEETASAPGQLSLARATAMGMPDSSAQPVCGLVGAEQVMHSPGMRIYNRLFRTRGIASSYVPLITKRFERLLCLLEELGVAGLSVTMPHKLAALGICKPDERATMAGAVNSLRWTERGWLGTNSDVAGVREPLAGVRAETCLILGAGGAARAAAVACRELGLGIQVCARRPEQVTFLQGNETALPWESRATVAPDVLINATPSTDPWPDNAAIPPVVFELALGGEASRLLARTRAQGASAIDPMAMWLAQGAEQMRFIFPSLTLTAAELAALS